MKRRIFVIAICFTLSACWFKVTPVRYDEERVSAAAATGRFVTLFNEQMFEAIYAMTDERAKATKSKSALIEILSGLREDRGKILNLDREDSLGKPGDGYIEVTLRFKVKFERSENHMTFVWYVSGGEAKLFSISVE